MPFEDGSFDHCYSIEACCHSPDRADVYGEIYRCLKPGGYFISYEWCLTDKHDPKNSEHLFSKKKIEEGDGLPDICVTHECDVALKKVGFELIESRDAAQDDNPLNTVIDRTMVKKLASMITAENAAKKRTRRRRPGDEDLL